MGPSGIALRLFRQQFVRVNEGLAERLGDRLVVHRTVMHVEPVFQMRVFRQGPAPALVGQVDHEGQGGVVERLR